MDPHTLDKLEFERIRELLAEYACCGLGRALAQVIEPSHDANVVKGWLEQLRQLRALMTVRGGPPFGGVRDIRELVARAVPPSPLEAPEYAAIGETLAGLSLLRKYFDDLPLGAEQLLKLSVRMGDFALIAQRIGEVVDSRGQVRDDASDKLRRIRVEIAKTTEDVRRVFDRLLKHESVLRVLQYPNATFHDDRMVLPLRSEQRGRVQGIIHRSSDSGRTLFVEPAEAVALNNALIELKREEEKEIGRLLWQLAHLIHLNHAEIQRTLDAAAVIDLVTAKARYADVFEMSVPTVSDEHVLRLSGARHPLLLAMRRGNAEQSKGRNAELKEARESAGVRPSPVVPIDIRLGDDFDMLIVTGPNTGGKTAALKTTGLLAVMAQCGMAVPAAAGATLPVFDDVLIDVGDEQSLEQSLSTFSAHLARVQDVLKRADRGTLVLLDEMGAGTDPDEGAALGQAIIDELLERRCLTIVTTHLGSLKAIAFQKERAENGAVQFDLETLRPTYELLIGEPGESNALGIAKRLGLPDRILRRADEHLAGQRRSLSRAIAGTVAIRRKAEEARKTAEEAARKAAAEAESLRSQTAAMQEQARKYAQWAERMRGLKPGDRVKLKRFDRDGVVVRVKLTHQQAVVAVGGMEYEVAFADIDVS